MSEWQVFLDAFNSGLSTSQLKKIVKGMKDPDNKRVASQYLNNSHSEDSKQRIKLTQSKRYQKSLDKAIDKMVSHPGFLSNKPF